MKMINLHEASQSVLPQRDYKLQPFYTKMCHFDCDAYVLHFCSVVVLSKLKQFETSYRCPISFHLL